MYNYVVIIFLSLQARLHVKLLSLYASVWTKPTLDMLRISLILIAIDNQVINRLKDLLSLLNLQCLLPHVLWVKVMMLCKPPVMTAMCLRMINLISKFFSNTYDSANVSLNSI